MALTVPSHPWWQLQPFPWNDLKTKPVPGTGGVQTMSVGAPEEMLLFDLGHYFVGFSVVPFKFKFCLHTKLDFILNISEYLKPQMDCS